MIFRFKNHCKCLLKKIVVYLSHLPINVNLRQVYLCITCYQIYYVYLSFLIIRHKKKHYFNNELETYKFNILVGYSWLVIRLKFNILIIFFYNSRCEILYTRMCYRCHLKCIQIYKLRK